MTTHISNINSVFDFLMGRNSDDDTDRIDDLIAAENDFSALMQHVRRTTFAESDDLQVRLALSALLGSWACVQRARGAR